jgi:hypothetical protein
MYLTQYQYALCIDKADGMTANEDIYFSERSTSFSHILGMWVSHGHWCASDNEVADTTQYQRGMGEIGEPPHRAKSGRH